MSNTKLSQEAKAAFVACISTRGPTKGQLRASAPPMRTDAYAAWQGAMMSFNPFKVSIGGVMFMTAEQRKIYEEVMAFCDAHPELRSLDRDRRILENMGAW